MPYIDQKRRGELNFRDGHPVTPGELNYKITMMILDYVGPKPTYQRINDVIGALESAKLEFYRRFVVDYEDAKISQNGDVY